LLVVIYEFVLVLPVPSAVGGNAVVVVLVAFANNAAPSKSSGSFYDPSNGPGTPLS